MTMCGRRSRDNIRYIHIPLLCINRNLTIFDYIHPFENVLELPPIANGATQSYSPIPLPILSLRPQSHLVSNSERH